jgi:hypothetical protein
VVNQAIADWPKIEPAIQVLTGAAQRNHLSMDEVAKRFNAGDLSNGG